MRVLHCIRTQLVYEKGHVLDLLVYASHIQAPAIWWRSFTPNFLYGVKDFEDFTARCMQCDGKNLPNNNKGRMNRAIMRDIRNCVISVNEQFPFHCKFKSMSREANMGLNRVSVACQFTRRFYPIQKII